jgi:hypothetical protein
MIPRTIAARAICGILLALIAKGIVEAYQATHPPIARVTVQEVVDPAPVRSVCDWIPEHVGCPGARK